MQNNECKTCKKCNSKGDGIGDTLLGCMIAVILLFVLFNGEPNIAESLRVVAQRWAETFGYCNR